MSATVLIVDDEKNIRRTLRMVLESAGMDVVESEDAEGGLKLLETEPVDVVILDVRLPKMNGIDALKQIRERPETRRLPVVMVSGHASVAEAVNAVQLGATDFFEKPLDRDRVLVSVRNAIRTIELQRELERLRADVGKRYEMIGENDVMRALYTQLEKVAPTKGRVLITGESGTGKELIARAIHRLSPRKTEAFIKVNCAAIPAELIESELFGYERGAFTGAHGKKKGMFELANHGTLFLDEIGDMTLSAQAKVLRALQSGEISRVGSEKTVAVDVRVIAATNKDLERAVGAGEFREDLYFRLNVVPIRSPSLRERVSDIPLLAEAFLSEFCKENEMKGKRFDDEVLDALQERAWPGNVRELRNVVERMAILGEDIITVDDMPDAGPIGTAPGAVSPAGSMPPGTAPGDRPMTLKEHRESAERSYILDTLEGCSWNISKAAQHLGVERTNLHKKMRNYGIKREEA
ncbi:MAG: sigma-54 dependent transcriptional regulator [Polyangiales bacterium]